MAGMCIEAANLHRDLRRILELWRPDSQFLGYLPEGAFAEYIRKDHVLVAVDDQGVCAGYLLFRVSRLRASIVHLCVGDSQRKKGVARLLVDALAARTRHLRGISLRCRRDFPANDLWPRLMFTVEAEIPGRGKQRMPLICWYRSHSNKTLFSEATRKLQESSLTAAMDLNILLDIHDPNATAINMPSKALEADWLRDSVHLLVTRELGCEINRQDDPSKRKRLHQLASAYPCVTAETSISEARYTELAAMFPTKGNPRAESDLRHIAWAIAGKVSYFITRDKEILSHAEEVEEKWQLRILDPASLIANIDELQRADEYQPVRLAGADVRQRLVSQNDQPLLADLFCNHPAGEKRRHFDAYMKQFVAEPLKYDSILVLLDDTRIGLLVMAKTPNDQGRLLVHAIRVARGELAQTLASQLVRQVLLASLKKGVSITAVEDAHLQPEVSSSLSQAGFFETSFGWAKIGFRGVWPSTRLADELNACSENLSKETVGMKEWVSLLQDVVCVTDAVTASEQEHYLWPAKIADANLLTYVVPVRAAWARELFDEGLAKQNLFGRRLDLALRTEGVYYRSKRGPHIVAPSRVLWYVSKGLGAGAVRACSRLDAVEVGRPKDLYRKYKRLGIYEWQEVYATAHNDLNKEIMVLRFSDTELLPQPLSWRRLQTFLRSAGIRTQVQQPVPISGDIFVSLYEAATKS